MQSSSSAGLLPVFVSPPTVKFYLGDQRTHKQVVTIYNVYDSAIRFRVLSTNPDKYTVVEPEGSIRPHCSLPIVVRHNDLRPSNCNVTDKFRIQFLEYSTKKVLGKRDITATLESGLPEPEESDSTVFEGSKPVERSAEQRYGRDLSKDPAVSGRTRSGPNAFIVLIAAVCIAALLMPNEGEKSTIPLQLSCNVKLVFAYVLGLVTLVVLQS